MEEKEKRRLLQEYENLKLLVEFHSTYKVIEDSKELEKMINYILDRMNEIKKRLETE